MKLQIQSYLPQENNKKWLGKQWNKLKAYNSTPLPWEENSPYAKAKSHKTIQAVCKWIRDKLVSSRVIWNIKKTKISRFHEKKVLEWVSKWDRKTRNKCTAAEWNLQIELCMIANYQFCSKVVSSSVIRRTTIYLILWCLKWWNFLMYGIKHNFSKRNHSMGKKKHVLFRIIIDSRNVCSWNFLFFHPHLLFS